ncbi:hypothetical protein PsorP6_016305 [Peronosclerospora sorghi]|uniref:Uncharacterized protein n=1 Tax=Peronosclerospora sorghi TaxID=230839 RepID=A0ACC0VM69_9STRA|nr:hypothetical protein PsorP6_016305 [Peronosclerospora sorghi]
MSLLSPSRREAIRRIRQQLCCLLCGKLFHDAHCLDCKHNFCRACILSHLRSSRSNCPACDLPTRPSEVTRNQFLESLLVAWKAVETELEALEEDAAAALHGTRITVHDTSQALYRAAMGRDTVEPRARTDAQAPRGRVANHKWHIDTHEIRQEWKLDAPYGAAQRDRTRGTGATRHWKKTSSTDLSAGQGRTVGENEENTSKRPRLTNEERTEQANDLFTASLDAMAAMTEEERDEQETKVDDAFVSPSSNHLLATQDLETYMDRISKQREALSQWERAQQERKDRKPSLLELERSLHCRKEFDAFVQERQREAQVQGEHDDLLTQMTQLPLCTSALESPDLLAAFESHTPARDSTNPPEVQMKRWIVSTSLLSRKRLRVSPPERFYSTEGSSLATPVELSQDGIENDTQEDERVERRDEETNKKEMEQGEYEQKAAIPLSLTEDSDHSVDHCERLRKVLTGERQGGTADAVESKERHGSSQVAKLSLSVSIPPAHVQKQNERFRRTNLLKPPVHASKSKQETNATFVFVSSDLTREEVKQVLQATQVLGGKVGHDFDLKRDPNTGHFSTSVTHLITKAVAPIGAIDGAVPHERRCKRTAKYMRGLAEGCFIVDFTWIKASLEARRWVSEDPFEMMGDIYSDASGKPQEARLRRMQTGRRNSIFSLFRFVVLVSETEFEFQFNSVRHLVNNFGGMVMYADKFAKLDPNQRSRRTPVGVVSKSTLPSAAKAKWHEFHIPIVRITWIFDSVSHLEVLPFDDYYPY